MSLEINGGLWLRRQRSASWPTGVLDERLDACAGTDGRDALGVALLTVIFVGAEWNGSWGIFDAAPSISEDNVGQRNPTAWCFSLLAHPSKSPGKLKH